MGSLFRSEEVLLGQMFLQPEAAYTSVSRLGEEGIVEFRDLNENINSFQLKYVGDVRRAEEMERKLNFIKSEIQKEEIEMPEETSPISEIPTMREITELEATLEKAEQNMIDMTNNSVGLKTAYQETIEVIQTLEKTNVFFTEQENAEFGKSTGGEDGVQASRGKIGFLAGTILRTKVLAFERMLWRMTRGNIFFRHADVEDALKDPVTGNEVLKSVFIVFFQGDELRSRIKKVCAGFHAKLHNCPNTNSERQEMLKEINTRLEDLKNVMKQTDERKHGDLVAIAKAMFKWSIQIKKMKATYHVMNKFNVDVTNKCLIAECWVPKLYLKSVRSILEEEGKAVGSSIPSFLNIIPSDEDPPTFNKTNKFTRGFQNLIDAYGIATYREVNPAFFTIITFPFLFGVMFGDMGHGIILTIFAAWMTIWEKSLMKKKSKNEIWNIFFGGRYIILLMGLYSIYIGFIYNDFFSISLNIFQSYWSANYNESTLMTNPFLTLDPATVDYYQNPYPVGMDPIWQLAENKIIFLNTYKMKISIIIGVIHMIFGVIMSVANFWHFKKRVYIFTDFLPQVIFLILIFFYLVVMVILKWVMYDATSKDKTYGTRCAPPVLILFINMILFTPTESPYPFECHTGYIYENQELAQKVIMVLAILCIPVMLIAKPAYILCNRKKKTHDIEDPENHDTNKNKESSHDPEDEPASEIIIHQIIHTIEYVLSTISHTASYLRLWALSLAHAQLSDVLWTMIMRNGMKMTNYVGCITIFIAFAVWAFFTIAILVMMEGLSAFLHTLRLHWVEFMSKFYIGLGYQFQPFSFKTILDDSGED